MKKIYPISKVIELECLVCHKIKKIKLYKTFLKGRSCYYADGVYYPIDIPSKLFHTCKECDGYG